MVSFKSFSSNLLLILIIVLVTTIQINISIPRQNNTNLISDQPLIADHTIMNLVRTDQIPDQAIVNAKNTLHIAYGHTSHGSQITGGMTGLPPFKEANGGSIGLYSWNEGGADGALDIDDYFVSGDLGNPDRITWSNQTRDYLENPIHSDVNVIMWSWCGQASTATESDIDLYLNLMTDLENDYPAIYFVYMTGHTDGSGLTGNLHLRNNQIRNYCLSYNKILFDFEDIESYNPDLNYFGDKDVTDGCNYDGGNWALEWQTSNIENTDWYSCSSAHSQPLNANQKAYAIWWLWAKLAGWDSNITQETSTTQETSATQETTTTTTTTRSSSIDTSSSSTQPNVSSTSSSLTQTNETSGFNLLILTMTLFILVIMKRKKR